jgi:hypothetical protein
MQKLLCPEGNFLHYFGEEFDSEKLMVPIWMIMFSYKKLKLNQDQIKTVTASGKRYQAHI